MMMYNFLIFSSHTLIKHPEPISRPLLLHHSADTLALLELEPLIIPSSSSPSSSTASNNNNTKLIQQAEEKLAYFLNIFSAHKEIPDSKPWCSVYGGHQYGFYAGQLGDGRVVSLGEIVVPSSPTSQSSNRWEVTLKGCGRTPYSRFGDGYCSLTACIREYLGSEFLAALGIPTTRCISVIASDRYIVRDKMEPSGCIARASPSWLRFGHFELLWYRAEKVELRELADYAIKYHFGGHLQQGNDQSTNTTTTITMTIYPVPMTDAPRKLKGLYYL